MPLDCSFTKFLEDKCLMRSAPLDKLKGTRIAIDAHNWMKVLTPKINEPFQAVMGGVPLTMGKAIIQELDKFKKHSITPIFVFNGLPMILTQSPQQLVQNPFLLEIYEKREQAWLAHHEGKLGCRQLFEQAGSTITSSEFQHNLIRILRENKVEFFKAPYMAWAQMAYWCQNKERCVHQIQGPNELIMFEHVEVLILDYHFESSPPEFDYIIKSEIKKALMLDSQAADTELTDSQFLDCCLLTGLKGQIKHPKHFNHVQFVKIAQTLQKFGNACDFIMSKPPVENGPTNQQLAKNHMRIRAVIRHSVVFTLDGQCQPMTHLAARDGKKQDEQERVPCNLSDLWGHRLPNILYFFLSIGAIQTQVLINVVQNQMIETIPQMDTDDYRLLLQRILPLRTQIAHQLIHQLGERDEKYFIRGPMTCWRWFSTQQTPIPQPHPIKLDEWDISQAEISDKRVEGDKVDFYFVVKHFSKKAIKDKGGQKPLQTYSTYDEVTCAIHLKALDLLGYFTHATADIGSEEPSSGLSMFSEALVKTEASEFSEYSVLLIELFRTRALTCSHFVYMRPDPATEVKSADPWRSGEREKTHFPPLKLPPVYMHQDVVNQKCYECCCLLVSRIWSLLPMELNDLPWFSDVSKDLLAFNTIVKALHKTLRNLIEVVAAVLFLESRTSINPYLYHELPQTLPFGQESNTSLGVVVDYIMRSHEDFGKSEVTSRSLRIAHLKEKFPCCNNIEKDLHKGFRFWLTVNVIFNELLKEPNTVSQPLSEIFRDADLMLRLKLHRVIDLGQHAHDDYKE
eukprot:TRINITY_DN21972_c0_g1_i1.p1 TRINITY_DN21972_c0_g1~~TRINITY_DN21972_c0_g1_i1.p1  ORF type:complete len:795 (+),score=209.95 TRINITY_DN21972_c0_g1_i1:60-2444(+)